MSDPKTFSLAVVKGPSKGQVLRTDRKRISVGSARDNDLILVDPDISSRHFLVLIDGARWRIHTFSPENSITVDRRWSHPESGQRGALIHAAAAEILLYPGHLDDRIIEREIHVRATGAQPVVEKNDSLVTQIAVAPVEFGGEDLESPTMAINMRQVGASTPTPSVAGDIDILQISQMPTIAGDRLPEDIRQAARTRLQDERSSSPRLRDERLGAHPSRGHAAAAEDRPPPADPASASWEEETVGADWPNERAQASVVITEDARARTARPKGSGAAAAAPVPEPRKGDSAWDRAKRRPSSSPPAVHSNVPEVLAEPESQILRSPLAERSVYARPDSETAPLPAEPLEIARALAARNARAAEATESAAQAASAEPDADAKAGETAPRNAWGDTVQRGASAKPSSGRLAEPVAGSSSQSAPSSGNHADLRRPTTGRNREQPPAPAAGRSSTSARNAWGDSPTRPSSRTSSPAAVPEPRPNTWRDQGHPPERGPSARETRDALQAASPRSVAQIGRLLTVEDLAGSRADPGLAIVREPDGELATSVRLLSTRLEDFVRTLGYRAYMLTSPEPLTGKSTAAFNLAFALAEDTHRRVALVEANFRFPRFAEIIGSPEDQGLIPLLEGRVQLPETIIRITDRNLVILPAGGRHPSPAEILASPRFKTLIAELVNTVDIAIIDAPSIMPFADTNLLLPLVDGALLVVAEGCTRSVWVAQAEAQIGPNRILGAIYNRIPKKNLKILKAELSERMKQSA